MHLIQSNSADLTLLARVLESRGTLDFGGEGELRVCLPSWTEKVFRVALFAFRMLGLLPTPQLRIHCKQQVAKQLLFTRGGVLLSLLKAYRSKLHETPVAEADLERIERTAKIWNAKDGVEELVTDAAGQPIGAGAKSRAEEQLIDLEDQLEKSQKKLTQLKAAAENVAEQNRVLASEKGELRQALEKAAVAQRELKLEIGRLKQELQAQKELEPPTPQVQIRASQPERQMVSKLQKAEEERDAALSERSELEGRLKSQGARLKQAEQDLAKAEREAAYYQRASGQWQQAYEEKAGALVKARQNERLPAAELRQIFEQTLKQYSGMAGQVDSQKMLDAFFAKVSSNSGNT